MDSDGEGSSRRGAEVTSAPGAADARAAEAGPRTPLTGIVAEQLPSGLYRVRLDDGGLAVAHIADRVDRNFVRVLVGDRVKVELSPVDSGRGRIVMKM